MRGGRVRCVRGDEVCCDALEDVGVCQGCVVEAGGIDQDDLLSADVKGEGLLYLVGAAFEAGAFSEV